MNIKISDNPNTKKWEVSYLGQKWYMSDTDLDEMYHRIGDILWAKDSKERNERISSV